jgi:magnesium transporter
MKQHDAKSKILAHYLRENPENAAVVLMHASAPKIADLFQHMSSHDVAVSLSFLPTALLAEVFGGTGDALTIELMSQLPANLNAGVLRQWQNDERWQRRVEAVLSALEPELAKATKTLLTYPLGTVGSIMHPVPFSVSTQMTIHETLRLLRKKRNRYSRYIYVVDENGCLEGVLPFKDAFYAGKDLIVAQLMTSNIFAFAPELSLTKAFEASAWRKWDSLPIADARNLLVGVLRYDAVEEHMVGLDKRVHDNEELYRASEAVGEVFQIGIHATAAALGFGKRKS